MYQNCQGYNELLFSNRGASLRRGVKLEACRKDLEENTRFEVKEINKGRATLYRPERQCKQSHMEPAGLTCSHMGSTGFSHMQLEPTKSHGARRAPSHVTGTGYILTDTMIDKVLKFFISV